MPKRPRILIVTPAAAKANNGNWQTAWRWAGLLRAEFDVTIDQSWGPSSPNQPDVLLALHARRSADSVVAWAESKSARKNVHGLAVVLTGTDLYRDIAEDAAAQRSLELAQQLVVLQELGVQNLPAQHRAKAQAIFQSTSSRQTLVKTRRHVRVLMVGHLRDEKMPQTLFEAAQIVSPHSDILIDHIGAPLDSDLGDQARATAAVYPNYRYLGAVAHEASRRHIQRAHLLVHASKMEGGAHVVMEAICSGTPVVASHIDGNVGMLGPNYPGYFAVGDAQALAKLLLQLRDEQRNLSVRSEPFGSAQDRPVEVSGGFDKLSPNGITAQPALPTLPIPPSLYSRLQAHCQQRAPLFAPATEQRKLTALVHQLLK